MLKDLVDCVIISDYLKNNLFFKKTGVAGSDGRNGRPTSSMGSGVLSFEEKKFLLAVERGDVASTRR